MMMTRKESSIDGIIHFKGTGKIYLHRETLFATTHPQPVSLCRRRRLGVFLVSKVNCDLFRRRGRKTHGHPAWEQRGTESVYDTTTTTSVRQLKYTLRLSSRVRMLNSRIPDSPLLFGGGSVGRSIAW